MPRARRNRSVEPKVTQSVNSNDDVPKVSKVKRSATTRIAKTKLETSNWPAATPMEVDNSAAAYPMEVDEAPKPKARPLKRTKPEIANVKVPLKDETASKRKKAAANPQTTRNKRAPEDEKLSDDDSEEELEQKESDPNNNSRKPKIVKVATTKKLKKSVLPRHTRGVGTPMVFGQGDVGQLGFAAASRKHPALIPFFEERKLKCQEIAAGGMHTVALTDDGKVYTWGCNDDLALGRVTEEEEEAQVPGIVDLKQVVVQITAGDSHSAALTEDGLVYAWGHFKDLNGSVGLIPENRSGHSTPQLISKSLISRIMKISSGTHHLVMLGEDGVVYTCGTGEQGQLGRTYNPDRKVTRLNAANVFTNQRDFWITPQQITTKSRIKFSDIFTGNYSTYLKTVRSGDIYVFGLNNYNQLGITRTGNEAEDVVVTPVTKSPGFRGQNWSQISAGEHHCVALTADGHVYSVGRGTDGRLGLEDEPEEIGVPTLIPGLQNLTCVQVACGLAQGYALTNTGRLYSWGFGENCQLGNGTNEDSPVPQLCEGSEKTTKLETTNIIYVTGGGQHAAIIACLNSGGKDVKAKPANKK